MYGVIVREYFPPQEAGTRLGIVLMATLLTQLAQFGVCFLNSQELR